MERSCDYLAWIDEGVNKWLSNMGIKWWQPFPYVCWVKLIMTTKIYMGYKNPTVRVGVQSIQKYFVP